MINQTVKIIFNAPLGKVVNYIILTYSIMQLAIARFVVAFDGYGRIMMGLVALSLVFNFSSKRFRRAFCCTPIWIWWLWCLYVTLTTLYFGSPSVKLDAFGFLFNYVILPAYCMTIAYMEATDSPKECLHVILTAFTLYVIMGIFVTSTAKNLRGGVELGNALPLSAMAMSGIAAFGAIKKWISKSTLWALLFLAFAATIFVATRKALVGIAIILIFYIIGSYSLSKPKNILVLLLVTILIGGVYHYIMDYTLIGERFGLASDEAKKWNPQNNFFLGLVGDRAFFYVVGYDLFQHCNQLIGVGLMHFPKLAHTHLPIHSEYMVQLVECGYIGCFLFLSFIISFFRKIKQFKSKYRQNALFLSGLGWLIAYLFICFTAWTYQFSLYFIVFGFIMGCIPSTRRYNYYITKIKQ